MDGRLHFIAGLPRSGSTLLAAILRQNPDFHAAMTGPVGAMYMALEGAMSRRNESAVFITDAQRQAVLKGLFTSYYSEVDPKVTVFDTNRAWCTKLPALSRLFPSSRVLCCVRSISWIMDSFERLIRRNAFELSGMLGFNPGTTVYTRVNRIAGNDGLVGYALDALREAFFGEEAERLILIEYQALAKAPEATMRELYGLLKMEYFAHDFNNMVYDAVEFDSPLGTKGLHTVRRKVEWIERDTVLPPDLFARFQHDMFWRDPGNNYRNVRIIQLDASARPELA
jgi:sulfotransferase